MLGRPLRITRSFGQFDLFMVGIGLVVGSGVFYKGGIVQGTMTGSGVFLGYIMCFVPIFLTALIFAEFTVEYPVAGGAFTWTMSTLGEFPALMSLGFLTINYILTIAAVARVLANSIALLFNTSLSSFVIDIGGTELDFMSFAIILILTVVLCSGTRESGTDATLDGFGKSLLHACGEGGRIHSIDRPRISPEFQV